MNENRSEPHSKKIRAVEKAIISGVYSCYRHVSLQK
jgi:hypothetical protein